VPIPESSSLESRAIDDAHRAASDAGEAGYLDPHTGLFVFTAAYLEERGTCCDSGCRHCPYGATTKPASSTPVIGREK
jgi:Family of unknown function (DUF5522)